MQIEVTTVRMSDQHSRVAAYVASAVGCSLVHHVDRIGRIDVQVTHLPNSDNSEDEYTCTIDADVVNVDVRLQASHRGVSVDVAIDGAAARLALAIESAQGRTELGASLADEAQRDSSEQRAAPDARLGLL